MMHGPINIRLFNANFKTLSSLTKSAFVVVRTSWVKVYLFTPWSRVVLEKLTGSRLVKKFTAFYVTRKFVARPYF